MRTIWFSLWITTRAFLPCHTFSIRYRLYALFGAPTEFCVITFALSII